jgi:choline dehydrogenase
VLFEDDRATGVAYEQDGTRLQADASEEVILSGGAVNSPQLLMLSGLGPADHLAEHDIDVREHLPGVGRNLQDHLLAGVIYEATPATATLDDADSLRRLPLNLAKFYLRKRGPLTSNIAEAGGFTRTDESLPAPDLQFTMAPAYFMRHGFDNPDDGHGFSIAATQLRPESRGRITLQSADPFAPPAIDPRYFSEPADLDILVEGVRRIREIVETPSFEEYRGEEIQPGADAETDEEIAEHIRETAQTNYHPVGTCKMGDDERAVVDDRLRVHGVDGLRVVDASIMPTIVGGNTNAPTIAIAERAADLIRGRETVRL